ncbi:MAG: leucyl aminopeptidase family protein [Actinobacteria bacterium]|nr:leucyl aminopeptidase family protein [Actinomycetota bacterium]
MMEIPKLSTHASSISDLRTFTSLAIGFTMNEEGKKAFAKPSTYVKMIEQEFGVDLADELDFFPARGKAGEIFEIPVSATGAKTEKVIFVGLGKRTLVDFRGAGAALARKVKGTPAKVFASVTPHAAEARAFALALVLGSYLWNMKSPEKTKKQLAVPSFFLEREHAGEIERAAILAKWVWQARDLVHTPSNIKTPAWMVQQAKKYAKHSDLSVKVLAGKELEQFGGLRAVGNSSPNPGPRFIEISYTPKGSKNWPHIVLVGKGITYDTGGISLKRPYDTMIGMKSDMTGAAVVLSVISSLPEIKPKVRVTALMMCAENALSRTSQRPGDVIKHYGGTTVEVINTDAEGRLVLADGLAYADKHLNPDYLVDIATLTGAATLGLGRQYGAMFTRNAKLAKKFCEAGEKSGDRVWHMPLIDDYQDSLASDVADLNHTASHGKFSAGAVTAALFLEHFVGKRNWVHFDVAGPARSDSDSGENPKGGTAFGVRLLIEWIAGLK